MRIAVIAMILLAVVSSADSSLSQIASAGIETGYNPTVPGGVVLYDQSYTGVMDGGIESYGVNINADDFLLTEAGRVESIEWWGLFLSGESDLFYLRIYSNNDNEPGDVLWEVPAASVKNTITGENNSDLDIYRTEFVLDPSDYFEAEASTVYWFSPHCNGTDYFWGALQEGGNMCNSYDGGDWTHQNHVGFFLLNGTSHQALEATTWAAIKKGY